MIRLVRAIVPAILIASSSPIARSAQPDDCIRFTAEQGQLSLVRTVRMSDPKRLSPIIDLKRTGSDSLGQFLRKGGSLVLVDSQGDNVGIVNRDTLDAAALNSDANLVKVSTDAVAEVDDSAVSAAVTRPAIPNVVETPNRWVFEPTPNLRRESVDLGKLLGPGTNPYGLEIGDFDGVAAPAVIIGENDGIRAPTPLPNVGAIPVQTPEARALNATVAIYFRDRDNAAKVSTCNGTQVAPGVILTNLHCASQRHVGHVVHFGPLNLQPDTLLPGTPVSGSVRCRATVVSPVGPRLDFALLRIGGTVPAPYASAIVKLDDGSELAGGAAGPSTNLSATQIQYWLSNATGGKSLQYEKYLMRPPMCAITREDGIDPRQSFFCNSDGLDAADRIDPRGIGHLCDSERGSSGSPLFDHGFGRILALHRGGGEFLEARNCAVPAKQIRAQLVAWGYPQG